MNLYVVAFVLGYKQTIQMNVGIVMGICEDVGQTKPRRASHKVLVYRAGSSVWLWEMSGVESVPYAGRAMLYETRSSLALTPV